MATNIISGEAHGNTISVNVPVAVTSGELVVIGTLMGIAITNGVIGELVALHRQCVVDLPKVPADTYALGDAVNYTTATKLASKTTGAGIVLAGRCTLAAAANSTKVRVVLLP